MYQCILFPTDGSELSRKAAKAAIELAQALDARLVVWSGLERYRLPFPTSGLFDEDQVMAETRRQIQLHVDEISDLAARANVPCSVRVDETQAPWQDILQRVADYACDLIFMASHGRRGVTAVLLGSETQKVVTHSTVPVLVYR